MDDWRLWLMRGRGYSGEYGNHNILIIRSPGKPSMRWRGPFGQRPHRPVVEDENTGVSRRTKFVMSGTVGSIARWVFDRHFGLYLKPGEAVELAEIGWRDGKGRPEWAGSMQAALDVANAAADA